MDELCKEKHEQIKSKFQHHEAWLSEHEKQIDCLAKSDATNTANISNLCHQIKDLVTSIRWVIGLMIPTVISIAGLAIAIWKK